MIDMIKQHIIPSCKAASISTSELEAAAASVKAGLDKVHAGADEYAKATAARVLRLETMEAAREVCDKVEAECPADLWTIATYKDLLFLDANQGAEVSEYE